MSIETSAMDRAHAAAGWLARLAREGHIIIPDAIPASLAHRLDEELRPAFEATPFCEGGFYGARTKRFGRLLARSPLAELFVRHPLILAIAEELLKPWCDTIQLNLTQAIAIYPGALPQLPHRDQTVKGSPTLPWTRKSSPSPS